MSAGTGGRVHPTDRARERLLGAGPEVDAGRLEGAPKACVFATAVGSTPGLSLQGKPTVPRRHIITVYKEVFPAAYDREDTTAAAAHSAEVLNRLARLREEPESDHGSTKDEGAPARGAGEVGTKKTDADRFGLHETRHMRWGQSLASLGRWPAEQRTCPEDETW